MKKLIFPHTSDKFSGFFRRNLFKSTEFLRALFLTVIILLSNILIAQNNCSNKAINNGVFNPEKYRKLWHEKIIGENIAKGKKYRFSRIPSYGLTQKGDSDLQDLTDGNLSFRLDGKIWYDSKSVGWFNDRVSNGVNCLIDLERIEPIKKVVIRILGGKFQPILSFPKKIEVLVSKDGTNFYKTASIQKLVAGEKSQSNFVNYYYLEENGKAFVYPFELQVNADARYIGISLIGETDSVFIDEIAAIKLSQTNKEKNSIYERRSQHFYTKGIMVAPKENELVISSNIYTPNLFFINDMRSKKLLKKKATLKIDLPTSLKIIYPLLPHQAMEISGEKYFRWSIPVKKYFRRSQMRPIFIDSGDKIIKGKNAYFSVECEGIDPIKVKVPIKVVQIPKVKPIFKKLHIGLAWMGARRAIEWPEFFKAWKCLGFNIVSAFPRNWNNILPKDIKTFLEQARKYRIKIVMNESPFHVMLRGHKAGSEIYSVSDSLNKNLCPSYRGKYYQQEMKRVAKNVELAKPDYVFWDIECWYRGAIEANRCKRCIEGKKKSGKNMNEYLKDLGTGMMKDLYIAIQKGSSNSEIKMPIIGAYNYHAAHPVHHIMMDFNSFYPHYIKLAMPSLYVAGRAVDVHNCVRKNHDLMKNKEIIPWLSAGCYGEFESHKLEYMVLEALMNGASGITYYWYGNFDTPMDFYYHAKALAEIAPYEDLIVKGEILNLKGSNKGLTYSAIKKGNEILLLIGNYKRTYPKTTLVLPFNKVEEIKDLRSNKTIQNNNPLDITVKKGNIIFYWIRGTVY